MEVVCDLESRSGCWSIPTTSVGSTWRWRGQQVAAPKTKWRGSAKSSPPAGAGRLDASGDVLVAQDWIRRSAAGAVAPGWDDRFESMCRYAESKGWIEESDGSIKGHVVWPDEGGSA